MNTLTEMQNAVVLPETNRYFIPSAAPSMLGAGDRVIYPRITVSGSVRFADTLNAVAAMLGHAGWLVYPVSALPDAVREDYDGAKLESPEHLKLLVDRHEAMIRNADALYVVNEGGYIGDFVSQEISYAQRHGKTIFYMEPLRE